MAAAILGWMGTAGTLLAYVLVSRGRIASGSRRYAALNIIGGSFGGMASVLYGAWPSAASNFLWAFVGVASFISMRSCTRRRQSPAATATSSVAARD